MLVGGAKYIKGTVSGQIQPNKVSWFMWSLVPLIAFAAEIKQGVGILPALMTFMAGFVPLLIFIASFVNKKAYWKIERIDLACGLFSFVGLSLGNHTGGQHSHILRHFVRRTRRHADRN